jgi:hypothetical protein
VLRRAALTGVAVLLGLTVAYVDSRAHWDDAGITAGLLFAAAGVLGWIAPERPWLWALGVGVWIPLRLIAHAPTLGSLAGGLAILAFPAAGAYAGALLRRRFRSASV